MAAATFTLVYRMCVAQRINVGENTRMTTLVFIVLTTRGYRQFNIANKSDILSLICCRVMRDMNLHIIVHLSCECKVLCWKVHNMYFRNIIEFLLGVIMLKLI